jgi:TPR repeat protein
VKRFILSLVFTALTLTAASDDNRVPTRSGGTISAEDANNLGVIHSNRKEHDQAIYWLKLAYEKGDEETKKAAALNLGNQHINKSPPDYKEATRWYNIAIKMDNIGAYYNLGKTYHTDLKDYPNAIKWYEEGFKKGQTYCSYALAVLYYHDLEDYPNAIKWLEIAHNAKEKKAALNLGVTYQDNIKDYPKAIEWYEIAHKIGNKDAANALGLLYKQTLKDYPNAINGLRLDIKSETKALHTSLVFFTKAN